MKRRIIVVAASVVLFIGSYMSGSGLAVEKPMDRLLPSPLERNIPTSERQLVEKILPIPLVTIEEFLKRSSLHGRSFKERSAYAQDVTKMLDISAQKKCGGGSKDILLCSKIVNTLGTIKGGKALQGIIAILSPPIIELDLQQIDMKVKSDALLALGSWINITKEENADDSDLQNEAKGALQIMMTLVEDAVANPKLQHSSDIYSQGSTHEKEQEEKTETLQFGGSLKNIAEENRNKLARAAVLALGLSGYTEKVQLTDGTEIEAQEFLQVKLANTDSGTSSRALIIESLNTHNAIAHVGIPCYYGKKEGTKISPQCAQKWDELEIQGSEKRVQIADVDVKEDKLRNALEALLAAVSPGTSLRAHVLELLNAHNSITLVGAKCYYQQKEGQRMSEECRSAWAKI